MMKEGEEVKKELMASSKEIGSAKEGEGEGEGKKGAKKAKKSRCHQCGTSIEVIGKSLGDIFIV